VVAANLPTYTSSGLLSDAAMREISRAYTRDLRIATPGIDREVRYLSGGNQQKVLLAKWLARRPRILIVDEPTRGVDVGSKAEIYRILRDLAANGIAVLVVSSDLPEVLALAHRIVVMSDRRTVGELDTATASEIAILELAAPSARPGRAA
jgi:ABC-type sugar transport system ATPase subunit